MRNPLSTLTELRHAQYVMGTLVEIAALTDPGETDGDIAQERLYTAMAEFERLEKKFSRFDPDSELSHVNRQAARHPVRVSEEFFAVIAQGLEYARQSAGCFSLQLAPLIELWEGCAAEDRIPSEHQVALRRRLADLSLIRLDDRERSIRFLAPGVELDLGGLAKGYAADRAAEQLQRAGFKQAVVNAGTSSIAAFSLTAKQAFAPFAIRDPRDDRRIAGVIELADRALATSGTSERRFQAAGRTFSHLIDPRTGWPLEGCLSATAICASAMHAEAVAKLLLFLGIECTLDISDRCGWRVGALTLRVREEDRSLRVTHTDELRFTPLPSQAEE